MGRIRIRHPGKGRLGDEGHGVERVVVLGERVGDEPVVRRVPGGGEQHPVEVDLARFVVHLVLVATPLGDLNDHGDEHRATVAGSVQFDSSLGLTVDDASGWLEAIAQIEVSR